MESYPTLEEEVSGLIPGCEISPLLDKKLAKWSIASYALALACRPSVSKRIIDHLRYFALDLEKYKVVHFFIFLMEEDRNHEDCKFCCNFIPWIERL